MGRILIEKIVATGELEIQNALHVGGNENELFADLILARNGKGDIYLPSTSLTGPMRAWWERAFSISPEDNWIWGPKQQGASDHGSASFIRIEDATLINKINSEVRDNVSISRYSGAAAEALKFDREIIPKGSRFLFSLILEVSNERINDIKEMTSQLGSLLKALKQGDIRFGGAKTRGLGQVTLENGRAQVENLTDKSLVLSSLQTATQPDQSTYNSFINNAADIIPASVLNIEINWTSTSPIMSKDPRQGFIIDMIPLTTGNGEFVEMVLPGSGTKGLIRNHAERIIRTLQKTSPTYRDNNSTTTPDTIIESLFGRKAERSSNNNHEGFGLGALQVDDCFPNNSPISRKTINNLLTKQADAKEKTTVTSAFLDENSPISAFHPVQHNAIDRWTGAAADGALYSILEPEKASGVFNIAIDLDRVCGASKLDKQAALALLLITLQDLKSDMLPVGFGGNRGLGAIKIKNIIFDMQAIDEWPHLQGEIGELDLKELQTAWDGFIENISNEENAA